MARKVKVEKFISEKTGEVQTFLVIDVQEKDRDFMKLRNAFSRELIKKFKHINGAFKLLVLVIDLAFETQIFNKPIDVYLDYKIAKERLGMARRTFFAHLKKLLEENILIKLRPNLYRLNPELCWIGNLRSYNEWLREQAQLNMFKNEKKIATSK